MDERSNRVFLLFFSGLNQKEIAVELGTNPSFICNIMAAEGQEWINNYLKQECKQKIMELENDGKNTSEIARILGKPWHRSSVTFVVRRLKVEQRTHRNQRRKPEIPEKIVTFRCQKCPRPFQMLLSEIQINPNRLCPACLNRGINVNNVAS